MNIENFWIISDTHFGHYNMVKLCDRPLNHSEKIAEKWDKLVDENDNILHLGDLSLWFGPSRDLWADFAAQRPGNKFLIKGNHDVEEDEYYEKRGFKVIDPFITRLGTKKLFFSHEPQEPYSGPDINKLWDLNIHGHIHNNHHHSDYTFDVESPQHVNMSVEVREYKPWRIEEIVSIS